MGRCKTVFYGIGIFLLLFFAIPIRVKPPHHLHFPQKNETEILFNKYIEKFNKTYHENDTIRYEKLTAFKDAVEEIAELNSIRKHSSSARFGLTKYSDMTKEEFRDKYLQDDLYVKYRNKAKYVKHPKLRQSAGSMGKINIEGLPMKVDWRKKNVVTRIKDQKSCGACWAFSTVETMESMAAIQKKGLSELSVQEIIDCAGYDNNGCDGGDICTLLFWLDDNDIGVQKSQEYPLKLKSEKCKLQNPNSGLKISNFSCNTFVGSEEKLLYILANHGPVAVAINAMVWQNYLGGVIHYHCSSEVYFMNHAVQIVGYDRTAEIPHYIVRNSWGPEFGDKGYLYVAIGSNMCGVVNEVTWFNVK